MDRSFELFKLGGRPVRADAVVKEYRRGDVVFPALNHISIDAEEGQVIILQGPSGCGKTTFLNLVGGIDRPDRGTLRVGDTLINDLTEQELSRYRLTEVGFVFQAFNLIPGLSVMENLELPMTAAGNHDKSARTGRGLRLLDLVGVRDKAEKRPDELSGGEQQRVAIAVALANDPALILADEPTGNLDSGNKEMVADLLCTLAKEHRKTVIMTTHDHEIAARGDSVYQIRDGSAFAQGSVDDVGRVGPVA